MGDEKVIKLGKKRGAKAQEHAHDEFGAQGEPVICSFCNRPNTQVIKMVQGPGVNICSDCVMIAVQYLILNDRMASTEAQMILDAFWGKAKHGK